MVTSLTLGSLDFSTLAYYTITSIVHWLLKFFQVLLHRGVNSQYSLCSVLLAQSNPSKHVA